MSLSPCIYVTRVQMSNVSHVPCVLDLLILSYYSLGNGCLSVSSCHYCAAPNWFKEECHLDSSMFWLSLQQSATWTTTTLTLHATPWISAFRRLPVMKDLNQGGIRASLSLGNLKRKPKSFLLSCKEKNEAYAEDKVIPKTRIVTSSKSHLLLKVALPAQSSFWP